MPFTLSHPALVLPLRKTALPLSALFIGAMAPDLNYFIFDDKPISHSVTGVFEFCLPAGIIFFLLFHYVLKYPIIDLFPKKHAGFLKSQAKNPNLRSPLKIVLIILAIIVGSFSHLLWDSFTHLNGWVVMHAEWMHTMVIPEGPFRLSFYRLLQHLSTLIGLAVLAYFYGLIYINRQQDTHYVNFVRKGLRVLLYIIIPLASVLAAYLLLEKNMKYLLRFCGWRGVIYNAVIMILKCGGAALTLYALLWHLFHAISGRKFAHNDQHHVR